MAQLQFPIIGRDLLVDVLVNLNAPTLLACRAAGVPAPASEPGRALIDTGSDISGVSLAIIQRLGLPHDVQTQTQGIGGSLNIDLFRASLSIWDPARPQIPRFVLPDLAVMELPPDIPYDVLIGMDVLLECRLLVDGPARTFTLDY